MNAWIEAINRQIGFKLWLGGTLYQFGVPLSVVRPLLGFSHADIERIKVTPAFKKKIFRRDGLVCYLCGHFKCWIGGFPMVVEHDLPVSRGGKTDKYNCHCSCFHCNQEKGTMTADEFLNKSHLIRNKFAGSCITCRRLVGPGEGYLKKQNKRWEVRHVGC